MIETFEQSSGPFAAMARRQDHTKRVFDICLAVFALAVLAPLILMVGALLAIVQGQPLLDSDIRAGRHGVPFARLRFRTTDGRDVTSLGHILLRTNIDELPQLLNVLRGDMSFVGPPPAPVPASVTATPAPLRPGLACPWPEETERADTRRTDLIGAYIRTWSLRADIGILVRAIASDDRPSTAS